MRPIYDWWFWPSISGSGVYVLIEDKKVMYVGKTVDLHQRLISHHVIDYEWIKKLLKARDANLIFWPCEDPEMTIREAFLIFCYEPPLNRAKPNALKLVPIEFLENEGDAMIAELRSFL